MATRARVGILISGRGSNMDALIKAAQAPDYPAEIVCVVSNRADAGGLGKAEQAGIATAVVDHKAFESREDFERELDHVLKGFDVALVCNAGFMRILTDVFVDAWRDKQLNIHPSLLPSFRGLNTHERALQAGVKLAGCTVHFVRTEMDAGPIIAQAAVPVLTTDTPDTLAARVLKAEHELYPLALELAASGKIRVAADEVVFQSADFSQNALIAPNFTDETG